MLRVSSARSTRHGGVLGIVVWLQAGHLRDAAAPLCTWREEPFGTRCQHSLEEEAGLWGGRSGQRHVEGCRGGRCALLGCPLLQGIVSCDGEGQAWSAVEIGLNRVSVRCSVGHAWITLAWDV